MINFWKNVRYEIEYLGLSQKELSLAINESYNTLRTWLKEERLPNAEQAVKIARVLGVTVEHLVEAKDSKPSDESDIKLKNDLKKIPLPLRKKILETIHLISQSV